MSIIYCLLFIISVTQIMAIDVSIPPNDRYNLTVDNEQFVKLNVTSNKGYPFSMIIYTPEGKTLKYAGNNITHKGRVSYFEINNLSPNKNKITLLVTNVDDGDNNIFDMIMAILSLASIIILVLEAKSTTFKILILALVLGEVYNAYSTSSLHILTTRIRINLLKIK